LLTDFLPIFYSLFKVWYESLLLFYYVFPFNSSNGCFIYLTLPMLNVHEFLTVMSSWWTHPYYQYIISFLISCDRFCITSIFYDISMNTFIPFCYHLHRMYSFIKERITFGLCLYLSTKYFNMSYSWILCFNSLIHSFIYLFFVILELECRALHLLGRCSTDWVTPPALSCVGYFQDRISWTICLGWF
jgi:hypothetical protein